MVNAATNLRYGKDYYKKGAKLPDYLVKHFEAHNPSLLSTYIEVNAKWVRIDDKGIAGMVKERKSSLSRLRDYFGITDDPRKGIPIVDNTKMLKARPTPKPKKKTEEELFELNRAQQTRMLNKLGAEKIPRLEKDRVKLLLKLQ